jgi:sulfite reductase alpha subunit-like flavoprotein
MTSPGSGGWSTLRLEVGYATETGTARELAERFARAARRRGARVRLGPLDGRAAARLPGSLTRGGVVAVLFVATAGDGELPAGAAAWWRTLLRADLPAGAALRGAAFAVFGCGDSAYVRFNAAARKVAARLAQLGAAPLCARGLGDTRAEGAVPGRDGACSSGEAEVNKADSRLDRRRVLSLADPRRRRHPTYGQSEGGRGHWPIGQRAPLARAADPAARPAPRDAACRASADRTRSRHERGRTMTARRPPAARRRAESSA